MCSSADVDIGKEDVHLLAPHAQLLSWLRLFERFLMAGQESSYVDPITQ